MERKLKLKLVFWGSLLSGIGLCIGGIWLPPILVPGGILLAAAFGMYQSVYATNEQAHQTPPSPEGLEMVRQSNTALINSNNLGLFFIYSRQPFPEQAPSTPATRPILELI